MDDYVALLKAAKEHVNNSVLYKRFISGTPLENDIAVWMADFAAEHATSPTPPAVQPGYLVVDLRYGTDTRHHVEGPMGLHPSGVGTIVRCIHEQLDIHERDSARLSGATPPAVIPQEGGSMTSAEQQYVQHVYDQQPPIRMPEAPAVAREEPDGDVFALAALHIQQYPASYRVFTAEVERLKATESDLSGVIDEMERYSTSTGGTLMSIVTKKWLTQLKRLQGEKS